MFYLKIFSLVGVSRLRLIPPTSANICVYTRIFYNKDNIGFYFYVPSSIRINSYLNGLNFFILAEHLDTRDWQKHTDVRTIQSIELWPQNTYEK